jgi:hypothetical protein
MKVTFLSIWEVEVNSFEEAEEVGRQNDAIGLWRQSKCAHGCHTLNNVDYLKKYVADLVFPEKPIPDIAEIVACSKKQ